MEENQNANERLQPGEVIPEAQESSEPSTPETSMPASEEAKEEPPTSLQTTDHQLQTTEMEVHKHPHHVMHKKKWNEYLLEFFMLFLAVFLGFVAENLREHFIEHKRANLFAFSMVDDLASDTVELKDYAKYMSYAAYNLDTLMQLLSANKLGEIPSGKLYWYGLWGGAHRTFVPNDATFQQMKSSGSLRYFTNKSISQKVAQYDQLCRNWNTLEEIDQPIYGEVRKMRAQIFEFRYNEVANGIFQSSRLSPDQKRIDSFILTNPPLLTYDKTTFNEYIELVRSRFISKKVGRADTLLVHARDLITELKEKYHLQ